MLAHCIEVEPTFSDAHILMAQIHLHQDNFKLANQSLEVGLSHNFEVPTHLLLAFVIVTVTVISKLFFYLNTAHCNLLCFFQLL